MYAPLDGTDALYVARHDGTEPIRLSSHLGTGCRPAAPPSAKPRSLSSTPPRSRSATAASPPSRC